MCSFVCVIFHITKYINNALITKQPTKNTTHKLWMLLSRTVTFTVHTARVPAPQNHSHHNQCRTPYAAVHTLVLLMMGIMMPETCWDKSLIINIRFVATCWFLSLHHDEDKLYFLSISPIRLQFSYTTSLQKRSQWLRGLRRRSAAARLPTVWVQIPPGAWMSVYCGCCVLSGRSLCDELITHPKESYWLWCVVFCDLVTSWMRRPWPTGGLLRQKQNKNMWKLLQQDFAA